MFADGSSRRNFFACSVMKLTSDWLDHYAPSIVPSARTTHKRNKQTSPKPCPLRLAFLQEGKRNAYAELAVHACVPWPKPFRVRLEQVGRRTPSVVPYTISSASIQQLVCAQILIKPGNRGSFRAGQRGAADGAAGRARSKLGSHLSQPTALSPARLLRCTATWLRKKKPLPSKTHSKRCASMLS